MKGLSTLLGLAVLFVTTTAFAATGWYDPTLGRGGFDVPPIAQGVRANPVIAVVTGDEVALTFGHRGYDIPFIASMERVDLRLAGVSTLRDVVKNPEQMSDPTFGRGGWDLPFLKK